MTTPTGNNPIEPDKTQLSSEHVSMPGEMSGRKVTSKTDIGERIFNLVENAYNSGATYGESPLKESLGRYTGRWSSDNKTLRSLQAADYKNLKDEEIRENLDKIKELIQKGFDQLDKELGTSTIYASAKQKLLKEMSDIRKDVP